MSRCGSQVGGRPNFPEPGPSRQTCDDFRVEKAIDLGENDTIRGRLRASAAFLCIRLVLNQA
jgi:hypothetical protein